MALPSWIGNDPDVRSTRSGYGFLALCGFGGFLQAGFGDGELKDRVAGTGLMKNDAAAVLLCDLLCQREAKPCAARLANAHERLEQRFTDGLGNAGTIVGDQEKNLLRGFGEGDANFRRPASLPRSLAAIEEEIVDRALDFARVDPALNLRHRIDDDAHVLRVGMSVNHGHGPLREKGERLERKVQGLPGAAEQQEGID